MEDVFSVELDYNAMKLTASEDVPVIKAIEVLNLQKKDDETVVNATTIEISTEYLKFYSESEFHESDILSCRLIFPKDYGILH